MKDNHSAVSVFVSVKVHNTSLFKGMLLCASAGVVQYRKVLIRKQFYNSCLFYYSCSINSIILILVLLFL